MITLPTLSRLESQASLDSYAATYFQSSGLPIPEDYLINQNNRVYGIFLKRQLIGGFILGKGDELRTLEVFANGEAREQLYEMLGDVRSFTEITCFWIDPAFRQHTQINNFIWVALAFVLKRFGEKNILFGTCSSSLARLYGITPKSRLIHRDNINGKRTFIFQSKRSNSNIGFWEILRYKWKRTAEIKRHRRVHRLAS